MNESSYRTPPDKCNPDPIDVSQLRADLPKKEDPASSFSGNDASVASRISMPTFLLCLALCLVTIFSSVCVSVATYVWIRAKGVNSVEKKTILYQNVTLTENPNAGQTPLQAQMATVQSCSQSVVEILAATDESAYQNGNYGMGSGVVWASGADELSTFTYIVTNEHVVSGCSYVWIKTYRDDSFTYQAKVIATDAENDLALLEIDAGGLTPVLPATSDKLQVGMPVFAVGNPLGVLGTSVTFGGISAVDRRVPVSDSTQESGYRYMYLIQHDAAINQGNSGGALFDYDGQLLGIVNAKISATGVEGLGYAIPIDRVQNIISAMVDTHEAAKNPLMGIGVLYFDGLQTTYDTYAQTADYADVLPYLTPGVEGIYVYMRNLQDTPFQIGDRLVGLGSLPGGYFASRIDSIEGVRIFLENFVAGNTIYAIVERNGEMMSLPVLLAAAN